MVKIEQDKLIIEIEHPCPEDFLKDLKNALIDALQKRESKEITDLTQFQETNLTLLEILKAIVL